MTSGSEITVQIIETGQSLDKLAFSESADPDSSSLTTVESLLISPLNLESSSQIYSFSKLPFK